MRTITVEVTQEDIASGMRNTCTNCPITLAVNRATGRHCIVDQDATSNAGGVAKLPTVARNFIRAFDDGELMEPFTFTLDVPDEFVAK